MKRPEGNLKTIIELNLGVLLLSGSSIFARYLHQYPAEILILARAFFSTLALFIYLKIRRKSLRLDTPVERRVMLITGVLLLLHWVTYFKALQLSSVAIGSLSIFTFPVMTALLEPLIFRERLKALDVVKGLIVFGGLAIVTPWDGEMSGDIVAGILFGVLSAFVYSFRNIYTKKYLGHIESGKVMFFQGGLSAMILLPLLPFYDLTFTGQDIAYMALLGVVFTAIAHSIFVYAFSRMKVATASLIASVQPIYSSLVAIPLLGEIPTPKVILGGSLIILAVVMESIAVIRKK